MPKKQAKGPFFFYMMEFRDKEAKHRNFSGNLKALADAAGPSWQKLTPDQKQKYEKMAKEEKSRSKASNEPCTAHNIPVSFIMNEQREQERLEMEMKKKILRLVEDAVNANKLAHQEFFFVHFNYFCRKIDNEYIPAEVAVSKFTLAEGICEVFHTLINPGKLPLGLPGEAKDHSDKVHSIPPPPFAKGEQDYSKILESIVELFIDATKIPILFTADSDVEMVQTIIGRFQHESKEDIDFPVFPITELFFTLKKATSELGDTHQVFPNIYVARSEFEKEVFDFNEGMGCDFHSNEASGKFKNCSKTKVTGWCYTFADYCCSDLGIELVPGSHLPKAADISIFVPIPEAMSEFSDTRSYVSANSRYGGATPSEVSSYTLPYSGVSSRAGASRPGPQTQQKSWKAPVTGPPPGYQALNNRDPRNNPQLNATNPFLEDINKNRERMNQTYSGPSCDDFPSLNESNRFSRSHLANETRPPREQQQARSRGMPLNEAWGGRP